MNASINTLMAITAERCLSICHPMSPVGKGFCKRVVAVIWFISLTITMPWAIYFDLQPMEEGSDKQVNGSMELSKKNNLKLMYIMVYTHILTLFNKLINC